MRKNVLVKFGLKSLLVWFGLNFSCSYLTKWDNGSCNYSVLGKLNALGVQFHAKAEVWGKPISFLIQQCQKFEVCRRHASLAHTDKQKSWYGRSFIAWIHSQVWIFRFLVLGKSPIYQNGSVLSGEDDPISYPGLPENVTLVRGVVG